MRKQSSNKSKASRQAADPSCDGKGIQGPESKAARQPTKQTDHSDFEQFRSTLAIQLHDLQNSLWPASVEIEVALSDGECSPKTLEMLRRLERSLEETMSITSQIGESLNRSAAEQPVPPSAQLKQ